MRKFDVANKQRRVLVVDDDQQWREGIGAMVELAGCQLGAFAEDGEQALAKIAAGNTFDVVITDACMPNRDGVWLLQEIYRRYDAGSRALTYIHSATPNFCTPEAGPLFLPEAIPQLFSGTKFYPKDRDTRHHIYQFLYRWW